MMAERRTRPAWIFWLVGIAITLIVILFFVSQLDLVLLGAALGSARYVYALPAAAVLLLALWTRGLRWRALLEDELPPSHAFHILNVSYLVNGLLPLRIGEVARAYLAYRRVPTISVARALSTVVVERLLDLLTVIGLIALAASAALPAELRAAAVAGAPLALGGLIALVLMAANKGRVLGWLDALLRRIPILQRLPVRSLAEGLLDGFSALVRPRIFLRVVGWTVVSWALSVMAGWVLMYAFWETADWGAAMLFIAAASLAIALPAVPGNIGTYEASIILGLSAFGLGEPLETATAFAVIVHAVNLLLYAVMGGIGLLYEGISLTQLREGVTNQPIRG